MQYRLLQPRLNYTLTFKEKMVVLRTLLIGKKFRYNKLNDIFTTNDIFNFDHARTGLQFVLSLLPRNLRVGVQPFTCHTVLEAIENAKCKVVFVDVNEQLVVDLASLQDCNNDFDVLIVTHTFGCPVDVQSLKKELSGKIIIEDCCHAFLSTFNGSLVGKIGDFSLFSHGFAKFPSAMSGGFIVVNSSKHIDQFHVEYDRIRNYFLKKELNLLLYALLSVILYNPLVYTFITSKIKDRRRNNFIYRKSNIKEIYKEAYVSQSLFDYQLQTIDKKLQTQRENANLIIQAILKNSSFTICQLSQESNCFMVPVFVKSPSDFIAFSKKRGVEISQHFAQSINVIPSFGYKVGDCERYEKYIQHIVTIPTHYNYPTRKLNQLLLIIEAYNHE